MTFIKINNTDMPNPSVGGYNVSVSDLDSENTTRSETGVLTRERVRANVYKLNCKWFLKTSDMEKLTSAIASDKFTVSFYMGSGYKTAQMYAGDKSLGLVMHKDDTDWWDVSCNFIEY